MVVVVLILEVVLMQLMVLPGWPWGGVGGGADGEDAGAEPEQAGTWGGCPSLSEVDIYRFKSLFSFDK